MHFNEYPKCLFSFDLFYILIDSKPGEPQEDVAGLPNEFGRQVDDVLNNDGIKVIKVLVKDLELKFKISTA